MMKKSCIIFLLVFLKFSSQEPSHAGKYRAAIVQYHPILWGDPTQNDKSEHNAKNFIKIIEKAAAHDADIVVFPEFGLMGPFKDKLVSSGLYDPKSSFTNFYEDLKGTMPELSIRSTPCDKYIKNGRALEMISCAARLNNIYIVLSLYEQEKCDFSMSWFCRYEIYNVILVFDRSGTIIEKRRKKLLIDEPWAVPFKKDALKFFTTDFGVTFGLLSGIDFMDDEVTEKFSKSKIKNIILLTHKNDKLPYFNLFHDLVYWSYLNQINLLVAGGTIDHAGDMIQFKDDKQIPRNHLEASKNALILIDGPESNETRIELLSEDDLAIPTEGEESKAYSELATDLWNVQKFGKESTFNSILLPDEQTEHANYKICTARNRLCCQLDLSIEKTHVQMNENPYYRYRFIALRKWNKLKNPDNLMFDVCAIVACTSENIEDCGKNYSTDSLVNYPTNFTFIEIRRAAYTKGFHAPIMTVDDSLEKPMIGKNFQFHTNKWTMGTTDLTINLAKPTSKLMIFGINSRFYDLIDTHPDNFWFAKRNVDLKNYWNTSKIISTTLLAISIILLIHRLRTRRREYEQGLARIQMLEEDYTRALEMNR